MEDTLTNQESSTEDVRSNGFKWLPWALGIAAVAMIAVLSGIFSGGDDGPVVATNAEVEAFAQLAFTTDDGQTATLADFRGEALVVNFFASWCAPCRAELPEFEEVHLANEATVTFIGVSHDLDETTWRALVEETNLSFQTVFQPNQEIWSEMEAKGMPTTAFVSPDGELLELWTGVLNAEKLQELIDENLLEAA